MAKPNDCTAGGHVQVLEAREIRRYLRGTPQVRSSLVIRQIGDGSSGLALGIHGGMISVRLVIKSIRLPQLPSIVMSMGTLDDDLSQYPLTLYRSRGECTRRG